MWTSHHALRWDGRLVESQERLETEVCKPEAALMYLDSLRLPNCSQNLHINSERSRAQQATEVLGQEFLDQISPEGHMVMFHCGAYNLVPRSTQMPYSSAVDLVAWLGASYGMWLKTQPCDHKFSQTNFGEIRRSFQKIWFKDFTWLEYSAHKDASFCSCCYLFAKGQNHKHGDDMFTEVGFKNWKRAKEKFRNHERSPNSPYSGAVIQLLGLKNQRHIVEYILAKQSSKTEIDYRARLTDVVKVIRFLLSQGLAFRGNDESINSIRRGNFLELTKQYCEESEEANKVMNLNVPGNNQLTSPKIQKEIVNACATEVRQVIVNEIGDKFFSLFG
ncbi:hypothetical protein M9H77_17282 [Catharanthus roseus]|uniref:Uncharacterized protein n=1 Tax=Catharanthus roseus TaxID=4058 RepID=A0ACC0B451_CATRO|nr:hypothetical protein M9H77_17282 [Catharanthus roseus]